MHNAQSAHQHAAVSIVIPVYGNLDCVRRCLESVRASTLPADARVLVINDASPDERIDAYCRQTTGACGWDYLLNEHNLGFVASANAGFRHRDAADVILLNSDTVVAHDWVQRLRACAYREDHVGTATPFSNNATICSYPGFPHGSDLPALWDTPALDALTRAANAGKHAEIPTAVGFCMYLRRACLNDTGEFDCDSFGQGYGEECDFSMRAAQVGWRHLLAADVFVYHEGGASFADSSDQRKTHADLTMSTLHPRYDALVRDFIEADPLLALRRNIDLARISAKAPDLGHVLAEGDERLSRERATAARQAEAMRLEMSHNLQQQEAHAAALAALLDECRAQFARTDAALRQQEAHAADLTALLDESRAQFARTDAALQNAQQMVQERQDDIERLVRELHDAQALAAGLRTELNATEAQLAAAQARIARMEQSRSWRYTAWLRRGG